MDTDMLLYFTVGRGILNGFTPYVDLFESKPPGMFLLASLSLLVSGDQRFFSFLGCSAFVAFPLLMGWVAWNESEKEKWSLLERAVLTVVGLIAGVLLVLYAENRSLVLQSEFFGSFLLSIYAVLALRWRERIMWWRVLFLSLCIGGAIGLKEPFVIAALAIALLLSRSPREFLRIFLLPMGCAALLGTIVLTVTGWWNPYMHRYLPAMMLHTESPDPNEPFWARGLSIRRIIADLTTYYTAPMTGYLLAWVWMALPLADRQERRWGAILSVLIGGAVLIRVLLLAYMWVIIQTAYGHGLMAAPELLTYLRTQTWIILAFLLPVAWLQWRYRLLLRTGVSCVVLYFASLVIGISIYATNHFAFAAAIYFTAIMLVGVAGIRRTLHPSVAGILWVFILVAAVTYRPDQKHITYLRDSLANTANAKSSIVQRLDGLLSACNFERYVSDSPIPDFGFSRHSPMGPLFMRQFASFLPEDHPYKRETDAHVQEGLYPMILRSGGESEPFTSALPSLTEISPDCAKEFLPIPGYRVYFPKEADKKE